MQNSHGVMRAILLGRRPIPQHLDGTHTRFKQTRGEMDGSASRPGCQEGWGCQNPGLEKYVPQHRYGLECGRPEADRPGQLQAMETAMNASRKINKPPTTGMTTGMACTMLSSGSAEWASCVGVGCDMVFPFIQSGSDANATDFTFSAQRVGFVRRLRGLPGR